MASKKVTRLQLEARRERILARIAQEQARTSGVQERMGFGYAMRAYSRIKHLSTRVGDELLERLEIVETALSALGWNDLTKRTAPVLSEEQGIRHYCEVMGLNFAAEIEKIKDREKTELTK